MRRIDDEQQCAAFNRYIGLLWVINHQLGTALNIIAFRVELAESAAYYFELFNQAAGLVEEHGGMKPTRGSRNWRQRKGEITVPVLMRSVALEAKDDGLVQVRHLWQELLAYDQVVGDLASDFTARTLLHECKQALLEANRHLECIKMEVELPEPSEEDISSLREVACRLTS